MDRVRQEWSGATARVGQDNGKSKGVKGKNERERETMEREMARMERGNRNGEGEKARMERGNRQERRGEKAREERGKCNNGELD